MVREGARDDLDLVGLALGLPVKARRLERRLVRLGAAGGEEDGLHVRVGERHQLGGELDGRNIRRPRVGGEIGQLLHLVGGRLGELFPAMAHIDVPEPRQAVDVLPALDVGDGGTAAADVHHRLQVIARVMERVDQVILIVLDEHCGLERHGRLLV